MGVALALSVISVPVGTAHAQAVLDTTFDVNRGLFVDAAPFSVQVASATPDAVIHYTLDGSDPRTSPAAMSGPSPVDVDIDPRARDGGRSLTPGVVLRAYATADGLEPTNVDTQTYIFLSEVLRQPREIEGWPTHDYQGNGGPSTHDYEMDPEIVDDPAYVDELIPALLSLPTISLVGDAAAFWGMYHSNDSEVPISVEVIYPDAPEESHQEDCGAQRHSHARTKNSIRLEFKNEYGAGKWDSALMTHAIYGGDTAVEVFDRIVLRGGNNRSWARNWAPDRTTYTTDEWIRGTFLEMTGVGSRGIFVHLYVNGIYWGLYNPVERPDKWFVAAYGGGEDVDWFSVSHAGPKGGDSSRYDYLRGALRNKDMADLANYRELGEYLHLPRFADYLLLHWYVGVRDWPQNNFWGANRTNPPGPFTYFAWDGEWSFGVGQGSPQRPDVHPAFRAGRGPGGGPIIARLFNAAKASPEFMILFADHTYGAFFNDGELSPDAARARWATLAARVRSAVIAESARWGDGVIGGPTRTRDDHWQTAVEVQDEYLATERPVFIAALRAEGYYPTVDPPRFRDAQGDLIEVTSLALLQGSVFDLTIERDGGGGAVIYTLDDADPRAVGGAVAGVDVGAGTPLSLRVEGPITVRARTREGQIWSAVHTLQIDIIAPPPDDAGAPDPDAGALEPDAGADEPDAGGSDEDGGLDSGPLIDAAATDPDSAVVGEDAERDAGPARVDAGGADPGGGDGGASDATPVLDGGQSADGSTPAASGTRPSDSGCGGCAAGETTPVFPWLALLVLCVWRRRRSRLVG